MFAKSSKQRYNVAVSRARNPIWLVYSFDPNSHLKPRDLRRRLIEHARNPQALIKATDVEGSNVESPFEAAILQLLRAAGYRVQTQWRVGACRIALVVEGDKQRLAVECDGEKWHSPEQVQRDIERQTVLAPFHQMERAGHRVRKIQEFCLKSGGLSA